MNCNTVHTPPHHTNPYPDVEGSGSSRHLAHLLQRDVLEQLTCPQGDVQGHVIQVELLAPFLQRLPARLAYDGQDPGPVLRGLTGDWVSR